METSQHITALLVEYKAGNEFALASLFPLVYDELKKIAHFRLSRQAEQTLNTTGLVHEAYLKIMGSDALSFNDRSHFFAVAAQAMRFILTDYARRKLSQKRGENQAFVSIDEIQIAVEEKASDVLALDEALEKLTILNQRMAKMVELKFFGGLTYEEIAVVQDTSVSTVKRDWQFARTWLYQEMNTD